MTEKVDVKKVAELARLKLKTSEITEFKERFNTILDYVGIISEVESDNVDDVKDESLQVVLRTDEPERPTITLDSFSQTLENTFFKVPKVIE
jgi:aspartyl-tRNA(Asn)/glutamyl-tRNA(Gln) amidotransferase subunit C